MENLFYLAALVSIIATYKVVTIENAVHALLYMIVSLFGAAVIFFLIGAPFMGVLELIVYAGAIMVLFIFVVMLLNIGPRDEELKNSKDNEVPQLPFYLGLTLFFETLYLLVKEGKFTNFNLNQINIGPKEVGWALFRKHQISIELASMILLAGLLVSYFIGKKIDSEKERL